MKNQARNTKLAQLVSMCVTNHTPEELALGWIRYETVRKMNPRHFLEIHKRNLAGEFFDDIVTDCLLDFDKSK